MVEAGSPSSRYFLGESQYSVPAVLLHPRACVCWILARRRPEPSVRLRLSSYGKRWRRMLRLSDSFWLERERCVAAMVARHPPSGHFTSASASPSLPDRSNLPTLQEAATSTVRASMLVSDETSVVSSTFSSASTWS